MKYSIVITCYNRENFIGRAIRSAINQRGIERSSLEVIVVDDNSTDKSNFIIKDYENVIKYIRNNSNVGLPSSRNKGIKKSKGKYIFMLDSDDYLSEDTLNILGSFLDNNESWDAVSWDYFKVDKNEKFLKRFSYKKNPIACGVLYRRETIFEIGLYNEKFKILEDVEFRRRYLKKYNIGYIELPLYRYTMHEKNMTKDSSKIKIYRKKLAKMKNLNKWNLVN